MLREKNYFWKVVKKYENTDRIQKYAWKEYLNPWQKYENAWKKYENTENIWKSSMYQTNFVQNVIINVVLVHNA